MGTSNQKLNSISPPINRYGRDAGINDPIDLIGVNERELTDFFALSLVKSPIFANAFFATIGVGGSTVQAVNLEVAGEGGAGRSDIEVETSGPKIIVEVKRGWEFPSQEHLKKYALRLDHKRGDRLVTLSAMSEEFVRSLMNSGHLEQTHDFHVSWSTIFKFVR